MATQNDLNPSILSLSHDKQVELIKKLRLSRRTQKIVKKTKAKSRTRKPKKQQTLKQLAAMLSPKQKAQLRAELLGG